MIKELEKEKEISEDESKSSVNRIQKITDKYIDEVQKLTDNKENEITSIR
jgi:ribosome recycling factor